MNDKDQPETDGHLPTRDDLSASAQSSTARLPDWAEVERLRDARLATTTTRGYRYLLDDFVDWCAAQQLTALPADAETLALYLTERSTTLAHTSLTRIRSAVRDAHLTAGWPNPGDDVVVVRLLQALARREGREPDKKPALSADLAATAAVSHSGHRDVSADITARLRAIVLLSWALQVRVGALARFGTCVTFADDGTAVLTRLGRDGGAVGEVVLACRDDDLCPVTALRAWVACMHPDAGSLFQTGPTGSAAHLRGQRLPLVRTGRLDQSIRDSVTRAARTTGADLPLSPFAAAGLSDSDLRACLARLALGPDVVWLRACAYVLLGLTAGVRHHSLSLLRWSDIQHDGTRVTALRLDHTKSRRKESWLLVDPAPAVDLDPYPALRRWRQCTGAADDDLVFCETEAPARPRPQLDAPLSARAGRDAVALFAAHGGLDDGFTTRSMRSGRVVNAIGEGADFAAAQAVAQHVFPETVLEYAVIADPLAIGWHLML